MNELTNAEKLTLYFSKRITNQEELEMLLDSLNSTGLRRLTGLECGWREKAAFLLQQLKISGIPARGLDALEREREIWIDDLNDTIHYISIMTDEQDYDGRFFLDR